MTDNEAIEALKLINLTRVHPFYSWEEMLEVRNLAVSALEDRITFCKRTPASPMTNADHIRCMSDKELAHELALVAGWDRSEYEKAKRIGIEKVMTDWLQKPYAGGTRND